MTKHIIIYSHGFGVEKDDRGLLTDIAAAMPNAEHILFDYNLVDRVAHTLTVVPIPEQVAKLQKVVVDTQRANPHAVIDMVAHSQGCVVAATAALAGIRRVVLLAPPTDLNADRLIAMFKDRPGTEIDLEGITRFSRNDSSTTFVPAQYWKSLEGPPAISLYNQWSLATDIVIVRAEDDEVLGSVRYEEIDPQIDVTSLCANHNFTGDARSAVLKLVKAKLYASNE